MKNRREFLKEMAAGAAILGAEGKFALATVKTATRAIGKSKVVIVRDDRLRNPGPGPDSTRVAAMLDHAMQTYAGSRNPLDPWKRIVRPGQVVGLKVNTIAGKGLSTNIALVEAICARLQQAGIRAGDIIVWDRTNRELQRAGYVISTDPAHVRCFGTDSVGYEEEQLSFGLVNTQVSKILNAVRRGDQCADFETSRGRRRDYGDEKHVWRDQEPERTTWELLQSLCRGPERDSGDSQ